MAYTVKKLSELSGVTIRTLHFYEEEDLIKPAYYGSNGYRYYGEKELLQLQQILFFKELGFTIKQIKKVIGKGDFDQLSALYLHRKSLREEKEKIGRLLKTIDKTINHLEGKTKMKDTEIFDGFNITLVKKAKKESVLFTVEETVLSSIRKPTENTKDVEAKGQVFYQNIIDTAHAIFKELVVCMEKEMDPRSPEVQMWIKKHHEFTDKMQSATQEVYKAMAKLYLEHPAFRKQLDAFHPQLAEFISEGMIIFADRELD